MLQDKVVGREPKANETDTTRSPGVPESEAPVTTPSPRPATTLAEPGSRPTHKPGKGSVYRYDQGCRCAECRDAKLGKRRRERAKARALNSPSYQRELAASRERKERYRGTCERCGGPTTGCAGPGSAPTICVHCRGPEMAVALRGRGKNQDKLRALLLHQGPLRYVEIRDRLGFSRELMGPTLATALRNGDIVRVSRGLYRHGFETFQTAETSGTAEPSRSRADGETERFETLPTGSQVAA